MLSSSHTDIESTPTTSKRRCRYINGRYEKSMDGKDSFDTYERLMNRNPRTTQLRLPFEAKIVAALVLFATTISISRTNNILMHFEGLRSLQVDQATSRSVHQSVRARIKFAVISFPRVVLLNKSSSWINTVNYNASFKVLAKSQYTLMPKEDRFEVDDDYMSDPTRQYDHTDSADLPSLERPKWPMHDFDPHCHPAAPWQSTFYPTCNEIHSGADLRQVLVNGDFSLLSHKGYWRHAWLHREATIASLKRSRTLPSSQTVWKTLK
jgi:hypothetical protein